MKFAVYLPHPSTPAFCFSEKERDILLAVFPVAECTLCHTEAEFLAALEKADVACVWNFKREWFTLAPRLRVISTPAAGRENIPNPPPPEITVLHGAFHGKIMAESVLEMMLAAARSRMVILRASTVVILGYGAIGKHIARLLEPFDCEIIGITRANFASLDGVLPRADHLVCVLPSDTGTDDIIDARRLALMKPTAFLYNVGRGNCIDENALCDALDNDRLAGAYLDVFKTEPLPSDHPLRRARNAVLTPHTSAVAPQYMSLYTSELIEKLKTCF